MTEPSLGTTLANVIRTGAELRLRRSLSSPPDRVWRALTDPVAMTAWFWPPHLQPSITLDLRVGGGFRIAAGTGGFAVHGVYRAVEAPHRLVFTWRWDGEDDETLATIELTGGLDATVLSLTHQRFPDGPSRDRHLTGWTECLDRLPAYLRLGQ